MHVLTGYTSAKLKLPYLANNAEELITKQMQLPKTIRLLRNMEVYLSFPLFAIVFVQTVIQRDIALVIIAIAI